ncbi:MAG: hypothetical protein DWQ19_11000 [Crenarchaeota archaeon]|nr:MAG: hypothetical protein DWQ19_11000 [Thermoproteota archaeon]
MEPLYFKLFLELEERQPNYLDALKDELGINPEALEKSPGWVANLSLGKFSYNGMLYKIENLVYKNGNISGAMVKPMNVGGINTLKSYISKGDQQIKLPNNKLPNRPFFVRLEDLNKILTQGMSPGMGGVGGGEMNTMLPGSVPL